MTNQARHCEQVAPRLFQAACTLHNAVLLVLAAAQAVKIALETKKYLVDNNLHDVTQVRIAGTRRQRWAAAAAAVMQASAC